MDDERIDNAADDTSEEFNFLEEIGESEMPPASPEEEATEVTEEKPSEEVQGEETVEEVADDIQEEEEEEAGATEEEEEEVEEEVVEEEEELDDDDSEDPRDSLIADLQARLDKLEGKKEEPEPAPAPVTLEMPEDLQQQILGDLDIDDVVADPKLFTEVLNRALKVGIEVSREATMRSIPNLVMQQVRGYADLQAMSKKFYNEHKELRPYKNTVAAAANEIHSEHPDWDYPKIMQAAAKRAKKTIGVTGKKKQQNTSLKDKRQKPAFAKTPKAKKVKAQVSKLQQDINDVID